MPLPHAMFVCWWQHEFLVLYYILLWQNKILSTEYKCPFIKPSLSASGNIYILVLHYIFSLAAFAHKAQVPFHQAVYGCSRTLEKYAEQSIACVSSVTGDDIKQNSTSCRTFILNYMNTHWTYTISSVVNQFCFPLAMFGCMRTEKM